MDAAHPRRLCPGDPRRGAPYTFVTTETFLAAFGMESLRDLPDPEQLDDAGLADPPGATEGLATGEASKGNRRPL